MVERRDLGRSLQERTRVHGADVVKCVVRLGVLPTDTPDVLQMTLVAVWRNRHSYAETWSERAWLFGIARLQALKFLRANAHRWNFTVSVDTA